MKILAQAIYDIRVLLSPHLLGSAGKGSPVCVAAHLAYALHNEALSVLEGRSFDCNAVVAKVAAFDIMFGETFASKYQAHIREN